MFKCCTNSTPISSRLQGPRPVTSPRMLAAAADVTTVSSKTFSTQTSYGAMSSSSVTPKRQMMLDQKKAARMQARLDLPAEIVKEEAAASEAADLATQKVASLVRVRVVGNRNKH